MADNKDPLRYRRSLTVAPRSSSQFNQFLPSKDKAPAYVPAPLRRKRQERHDDSRRSWTGGADAEEDGTFYRSKSMSDITADQRQQRYEELQKARQQSEVTDDKWQDDLTAWKNRRRSVNSDIVKKKEEREQIEQTVTSADGGRRSTTFRQIEEERGNSNTNSSIGSRLRSLASLDQEDVFENPIPPPARHARARPSPTRSYTVDTPYSRPTTRPPSPPPRQVDPPAATPAADRASSPPTVPLVESPAATTTISAPSAAIFNPYASSTPAPMESSQRSLALEPLSSAKPEETTTTTSTSSSLPKVPESSRPPWVGKQAGEEALSAGPVSRKAQPGAVVAEPGWPPGVSRVSASLPRSYQRSDSARLTSVVTPRPFGSQSTRVASLPRAYTMDDSLRRVNGEADRKPAASLAPSRYSQVMSSEDEARSVSSSAHSSNEDEEEAEAEVAKAPTTSPAPSVSPVPPHPVRNDDPPPAPQPEAQTPPPESVSSPAPAKDTKQESYCDMRISLNQKPNSNRDFGFHADWDSTGAHVTSIQPGSSAELCQLQLGDEVLAVSGQQVAAMSFPQWRSSLEEALQRGTLAMDIRRHGKNSGPASTATSLDFTSRLPLQSTAKEVPSYPIIDVASNGVNGGFRDEPVTMRNKGGSESAISDLAVPSIAAPSTRWSWDPEEERRRQEKWQREQERLLQEKYKRDQEKLEEEWLKDQQDAELMQESKDQQEPENLEVGGRSTSPYSPVSPLSPPPWEDPAEAEALALEEERRKEREEQERKRQEEERRRREEEERELQRLQEERKRREQQEEEERKAREEEELRWQRKREEEKEEAKRRQEAEEEQQQRRRESQREQQRWGEESYGIAHVQPELTMTDRVKSKSTPQLDEPEKPEMRVTGGGLGEASWGRDSQKKGQSLSQAELERQQILQEMKKKTHLLTDNSWIRQRSISTATSKEPIGLPGPIRRGESLDNLDVPPRSSWRSSWTPGSTSSIPNYSRPHSAMSGTTPSYARPSSATLPSSHSLGSLRLGGGNPSSSWSQRSSSPTPPSPTTSPNSSSEPQPSSQQRGRSVSGKKICTLCDSALGKGAAMIIESLGLCYHLSCFKCIDCRCDLGGSEAGAEVRIRNRQLFCNTCYMRVKSGQPTSM